MKVFAFGFAFLAGALISVQAGSNTQLKKALGDPIPAAVVNYIVGAAGILAYSIATRVSVPSTEQAAQAPWWSWIGGLFGLAYGLAVVVLGNRLGAATLMALVVAGQLVCSVVLDHYGWMGFDVRAATFGRIGGCVLMVAGMALVAMF